MITCLAGLCAASLLWMYRHVVEESRREMNEGWREVFVKPTPRTKPH